MKRVLLTFVSFALLTLSTLVHAQDKTVSGKVTGSDDGLPLPQVTVLIKGTTKGTPTDMDGNYSLSGVPAGATLVFRYLGYVTQEVEVGNQSVINVQLAPDATSLGEVVVSGVASGTPTKKLTITVAKVDKERLQMAPATSAAGALVGKVAGVRIASPNGSPGAEASVQLRGDNNLNVGSGPMVVVDGVIIQGGLADINVDDIESYEVIKGASAASLYGSRAGNGVIVITTQRGNTGDVGVTNVTLRQEFGFQSLAKTIDLAESHPFTLASDYQSFNTFTKYAGVTYPAGYKGGYDPNIVGTRGLDADHYMDNPFGVTRDIQDQFFKTGNNMTSYVGVSTRSAKTNAFISFENNKQTGIIPDTDGFQRQNIRLNIDHNVTDWLKVSATNLVVNTTSQFPGGGNGIFFNLVLAEPDNDLYLPNPDGQPYFIRHNQWSNETNPLYGNYKVERSEHGRRFLGNYRANVSIMPGVEFEASYSNETEDYRSSTYQPFDTWILGTSGPGANEFGTAYSQGSLSHRWDRRVAQQVQTTFNLSKNFGDITAKGKISYLYENQHNFRTDVSGFDFLIRDIPTFSAFDQDNVRASNSEVEIRASNYFFIGSLDYKDKILFDGMYRIDGSSLFGEDSRWANYYRVSGGYRITEDIDIPNVSELKIRAAYGIAGIRPEFDWQYETYSVNNGQASPSTLGNKNLKPSRTEELEVAIESEFLDIFSLQMIYAKSRTTDQFLYVRLLPIAGGFNGQRQNAGAVESNTFEATLGANLFKNKDFTWDATVTFTRTRQTITDLPIAPYQSGSDNLFYIRQGETYGSIYGYTWVTSLDQMAQQLPEGRTIADYEVNSDGFVVRAGSQGTTAEAPIRLKDPDNGLDAFVKIGDGNPDFYMGISNTFRYKGFTAYFLFDIKQGGDVYNRKSQWLTRDNRNGIMDMAGVPDGQKKAFDYYQGLYDVNSNNSYWVEDASYIKLRELSLGYSFSANEMSSLFGSDVVKGANLRVIGRNLFTISDYSGYDPEVGSLRNPYDGTGTYPNFRNVAVSLTLNF